MGETWFALFKYSIFSMVRTTKADFSQLFRFSRFRDILQTSVSSGLFSCRGFIWGNFFFSISVMTFYICNSLLFLVLLLLKSHRCYSQSCGSFFLFSKRRQIAPTIYFQAELESWTDNWCRLNRDLRGMSGGKTAFLNVSGKLLTCFCFCTFFNSS